MGKSSQALSSIIFRFEKKKENVYKRSYMKGLNVISEIGGLSSVLTTLGLLISYFYTQTHLNKELINNTFVFEEKQPNEQRKNNRKLTEIQQVLVKLKTQNKNSLQSSKNPIKQSNQEIINQKINKQTSPIVNQISNNKKLNDINSTSKCISSSISPFAQEMKNSEYKEDKINEQVNKQNQKIDKSKSNQKKQQSFLSSTVDKIKFSIIEYFSSYFIRSGKYKWKKQLFDHSVKQLYDQIDIQQLINKFIEFDKLKRILFDDDQLLLFDYLPKPSILYSLQNNKIQFHEDENFSYCKKSKNEVEKIQRAINSYKRVQVKENLNEIDEKILQYLDESYKQLFDEQSYIDLQFQEKKQRLSLQNQQQINFNFKKDISVPTQLPQDEISEDCFVNIDQNNNEIEDHLKIYNSLSMINKHSFVKFSIKHSEEDILQNYEIKAPKK